MTLTNLSEKWRKNMSKLSGNLTTNERLPVEIQDKLLDENINLKKNLEIKEIEFPSLNNELKTIKGLNIISELQKLDKNGCLTVFRAIRFPTISRIWQTVNELGLSMSNYEQERILKLYNDTNYLERRGDIQKHRYFQNLPQERIVKGIPVFSLVNDALQIHRAYRNSKDRILLIVSHIPYELIEKDKIELIANTAIDMDYSKEINDHKITEFKEENGNYLIDYKSLRIKGIDLHEMYLKGLPFDLEGYKNLDIEHKFFLLDIYEFNSEKLRNSNTEMLKEHEYFLHGFFGNQNPWGRGAAKYLPSKCFEVKII